jgi:hypothetical protein
MFRKYILVCLIVLCLSTPASGASLGDVSLPDSITENGTVLNLNGMGMRTFAFFDVYAAGLYLPSPSTDDAAILAADAPRIMTMHFLREVGAEKIAAAWLEGLEANTPGADASLKERFARLGSMMETLDDGQALECVYAPGAGTTIRIRGQVKGTIQGKDFSDALLACWIGPEPGPGKKFKAGVLGLR